MEEEAKVISEVSVTKVVEEADHKDDNIKETNGDLSQVKNEGKREEEENAFDGEFIKVEKEENPSDDKSQNTERSSDLLSSEFLESQKKLEVEQPALDRFRLEFENEILDPAT